jgi:hypothetical protein
MSNRLEADKDVPDDLTLLRSCRLMLYAWHGVRTEQGFSPHRELEELLRQLDKRVSEADKPTEADYNARWFWDD